MFGHCLAGSCRFAGLIVLVRASIWRVLTIYSSRDLIDIFGEASNRFRKEKMV